MLIIKKREKAEETTFTQDFRGNEITLTVRPFDTEEIQKITRKHTKYIVVVHPTTKQAVRVAETDNSGIGKDIIDYLLVSFSGIGTSASTPLEVTRENKIIVASLALNANDEEGGHLMDIIQRKSQELSEAVEIETAEQEKNSGGVSGTLSD